MNIFAPEAVTRFCDFQELRMHVVYEFEIIFQPWMSTGCSFVE